MPLKPNVTLTVSMVPTCKSNPQYLTFNAQIPLIPPGPPPPQITPSPTFESIKVFPGIVWPLGKNIYILMILKIVQMWLPSLPSANQTIPSLYYLSLHPLRKDYIFFLTNNCLLQSPAVDFTGTLTVIYYHSLLNNPVPPPLHGVSTLPFFNTPTAFTINIQILQ